MSIRDSLRFTEEHLASANIAEAKIEAELIWMHVLSVARYELYLDGLPEVTYSTADKVQQIVFERITGKPLAYVLGIWKSYAIDMIVSPDVLIPRPETELMVEKIVKIFKTKDIFILDIGTGTGCILLSILSELKNSKGIGIDISQKAIQIAKQNLKKHKLSHQIKFLRKSLTQIYRQKFDLIVSNPPYIIRKDIRNLDDDIKKFEPKLALDGGNDGLDVIKKVIYKSKSILKKKGIFALEIGYGQYKKVSQILGTLGFKEKVLIKDYQDNIRCIITSLEI